MADRRGGRRPPRPLPAHGTRARYVRRAEPCRCPACTRANRDYIRRWRGAAPGWDQVSLWPGQP